MKKVKLKIVMLFLSVIFATGCQINAIPATNKCLCAPSPPFKEVVADADFIYSAKITKITKGIREYIVYATVEKVWKSYRESWKRNFVAFTKLNIGNNCPYPLEKGQTYLFIDVNGDAGKCSPIFNMNDKQAKKIIKMIED